MVTGCCLCGKAEICYHFATGQAKRKAEMPLQTGPEARRGKLQKITEATAAKLKAEVAAKQAKAQVRHRELVKEAAIFASSTR